VSHSFFSYRSNNGNASGGRTLEITTTSTNADATTNNGRTPVETQLLTDSSTSQVKDIVSGKPDAFKNASISDGVLRKEIGTQTDFDNGEDSSNDNVQNKNKATTQQSTVTDLSAGNSVTVTPAEIVTPTDNKAVTDNKVVTGNTGVATVETVTAIGTDTVSRESETTAKAVTVTSNGEVLTITRTGTASVTNASTNTEAGTFTVSSSAVTRGVTVTTAKAATPTALGRGFLPYWATQRPQYTLGINKTPGLGQISSGNAVSSGTANDKNKARDTSTPTTPKVASAGKDIIFLKLKFN
jgi:hypothetical protein